MQKSFFHNEEPKDKENNKINELNNIRSLKKISFISN